MRRALANAALATPAIAVWLLAAPLGSTAWAEDMPVVKSGVDNLSSARRAPRGMSADAGPETLPFAGDVPPGNLDTMKSTGTSVLTTAAADPDSTAIRVPMAE
ncbi:hypothetical protein ACFOGJ_20640 [Marinibaculum pumilum]|uniref:Uncharacterized protein n=1 Tax=Marinibaculum pumilum TaxID=1766165 RepID=A0ABV7L540_9PROT